MTDQDVYEVAARAYCAVQFEYPPEVYAAGEPGAESHLANDARDTAQEPWLHAVVDAVVAATRQKIVNDLDTQAEQYRASLPYTSAGPFGQATLLTFQHAARVAAGIAAPVRSDVPRRPASHTCTECGRTSYNPNDVRERYCGACHHFCGQPWVSGYGQVPAH